MAVPHGLPPRRVLRRARVARRFRRIDLLSRAFRHTDVPARRRVHAARDTRGDAAVAALRLDVDREYQRVQRSAGDGPRRERARRAAHHVSAAPLVPAAGRVARVALGASRAAALRPAALGTRARGPPAGGGARLLRGRDLFVRAAQPRRRGRGPWLQPMRRDARRIAREPLDGRRAESRRAFRASDLSRLAARRTAGLARTRGVALLTCKRKRPTSDEIGRLVGKALAMTYFLTANPQYHRRDVVSRPCSEWEGR